jgi:outer membrane lipoprotein-sorting protein
MKHLIKSAILTAILVVSFISLNGQSSARDIFTDATDQLLTGNMELSLNVSITDKKGRVKEKGYEVLIARFGDVEKTKMSFQKPVQAKGTTVIFTQKPDEIGLIEVYTPSNGKIRKLQATEDNMKMVGSEAQITNVTRQNPDDLEFIMLPIQDIEGTRCYTIEVKDKEASGEARGELVIEIETSRIRQITVYNNEGVKTSFVKLSDFQPVDGFAEKMQPRMIVTEDFANQKVTEMSILKVTSRPDLSEADFQLPVLDQL